jgi:endonuclease/exonuclease/phosphatase family metal-dependent hydrolase
MAKQKEYSNNIDKMMLRILSYNIHGGYDVFRKRDLIRLNQFLDDHNIDIAILQEFETRESRGATLKDIDTTAGDDRPHRLPGLTMVEGEGWYGNLIVSRYPNMQSAIHDLETSPSKEPRNAVDALIDTPIGNIRIIGTHLSLSPFERYSEVRKLVPLINQVDITETGPLLLMGDINEWRPTSKLLRFLDDHFTQIPLGKTFPSYLPLFKLDRVWYDNMADRKVSAKILKNNITKRLSDHLPILIEITT